MILAIETSQRSSKKNILAGLLGTVLEHYDNALYALLVPFITPLFFSHLPYITGLIVAYGIQINGLLIRPLGSLVFGYLGDRHGRKKILYLTIFGMTLSTVGIGFLPTSATAGALAPLLLIFFRSLQSFFVGGETKGGVLFVLEHGERSWRGFLGSLCNSSMILGCLLASALVALLASLGLIETHWRLLFWLGGLTGIPGILIRLRCDETADFKNSKAKASGFLEALIKHKFAIAMLILATGFTYVTYMIPFVLMNSFLPLITTLTKTEAVQMNTWLLGLDLLLLPCFGWLTRVFSPTKIMQMAALSLAICGIPLFSLLGSSSIPAAIFVRSVVVVVGIAFAAPFHQWSMELIPVKERYLVSSFANSVGSQLIGVPCTAISLWMYHSTGWVIAPGIYLSLAACGAVFALYQCSKKRSYLQSKDTSLASG